MSSHRNRSRFGSEPEPISYLPFAITFLGVIGALPFLARRMGRDISEELKPFDVAQLCLGTFAASHILVKDKVASFIREPVIEHAQQEGATLSALRQLETGEDMPPELTRAHAAEKYAHDHHMPSKSDLELALGELFTCTRCMGTWNATVLTYLRVLAPAHGKALLTVLAAGGVNNFLQAAFSDLRYLTNREQAEAKLAARRLRESRRTRERPGEDPESRASHASSVAHGRDGGHGDEAKTSESCI